MDFLNYCFKNIVILVQFAHYFLEKGSAHYPIFVKYLEHLSKYLLNSINPVHFWYMKKVLDLQVNFSEKGTKMASQDHISKFETLSFSNKIHDNRNSLC